MDLLLFIAGQVTFLLCYVAYWKIKIWRYERKLRKENNNEKSI